LIEYLQVYKIELLKTHQIGKSIS